MEKILVGSKVLSVKVENLGGLMSGKSSDGKSVRMSLADAKKNGILKRILTYYSGNGTKYAYLSI